MSAPIRVLFVSGGSLDNGGITAVMLNYLNYIDPSKVRIDILVHGFDEGVREKEAKSLGATVYHVPYKRTHYLTNRRAILDVMRGGKYDVVHAHMDGMNGYILRLAKACGVSRRVSHSHNTQFLTTNPLRVLLHRRTADRIPRYATDLYACSERAARFLYGDALVEQGKTVTIKNAITLDAFRFSQEARERLRCAFGLEGKFAVGCVGRYDYQKNQAFLLDAFAEVVRMRPEAVLLLVGDGADRSMLEERVRSLGLTEHVRLTGYRQDVSEVLSALDLLVMPSRFEGLGIALIEAQACGLPCVASDQVPQDTNVLSCAYLPLDDAPLWTSYITNARENPARNVSMEAFRAAGYDIALEAERLTARYCDMVKPRVLFLSNIPAPYRIDFFNELGSSVDLTVLFEARRAKGVRFNWNENEARFQTIFLSDGEIDETHVNTAILPYIERGVFDRIVATNYGYYTETAALAKMRLLGVPYDLELDGGLLRTSENPLKRMLKRWIIRGAARLFSPGAATDALFLHYGAEKGRIVRYPFTSLHESEVLSRVPTAGEKRAAKDELGVQEAKVALYVGQFIRRKGVDVLLNACAALPKDTRVLIVGGEPTKEYQTIVERLSLTNVTFLPFMAKDALMRCFAAADVFVLPTREDVWGLVVNEAMANALPVVTTTACAAGVELVRTGENGALVPPEDERALAEALTGILADDALRASMAAQALLDAHSYTIERMVRVHTDVFSEADDA